MSFDIPIVARATTAVPGTLGDAGLLIEPHEGPILFAETMREAIENEPLRAELIGRGRRRLREFDSERARATFLQHLLDVL